MNQTIESNQPSQESVAEWLDRCEADLVHPGVVQSQLRRHGWVDVTAAAVAADYRRRFNEHVLGYSALLGATGVAALAAGTAGHTLTAGLTRPVNRSELAICLSVLACACPAAIWAHLWARGVDRHDPVAVWSRPRHNLSLALLWGCGLVGGIRLIAYATQLIGVAVSAPWAVNGSLLAGAINVAISLVIALPLGMWAHRFLHRFDGEDPTAPPVRRQRQGSLRPPAQ